MRSSIFIILIQLAIVSCKHSNVRNATYGQPVKDLGVIGNLAGNWYATAETHAMLAKKKYARDSVYVKLNPDSSFKVRLPDCLDAAAKGGLIWDAIGAWRIHKNGEAWKLGMAFEKGRLFRYRTFTDFDITVLDSVLILSRFIGDPDEGERLTFRKSK